MNRERSRMLRFASLCILLSVIIPRSAVAQTAIYLHDQERDTRRSYGLSGGVGFTDYRVEDDRGRTSHYYRVVRHEPLLDDALRLEGDVIHPWGQELTIQVDLPAARFRAPGDSSNDKAKRGYTLSIVALGRHVRGGGVRAETVVGHVDVSSPSTTYRLSKTERILERMTPGTYEARIQAGGFVVARQRIVVVVNQAPGTIERVESPRAGMISVQSRPPAVSPGFFYVYDLNLLGKDGRRRRPIPTEGKVVPGRPTVVGAADRPGVYTIDLILAHEHQPERYVLDTLLVESSATAFQQSMGGMLLTFDGEAVSMPTIAPIEIRQGEEIPIEFSFDEKVTGREMPKGLVIELHSMPEEELEASWDIGRKKKAAWRYEVDAAPGEYEVRLGASFFGQSSGFVSRNVRISPPERVGLVVDEPTVRVGEPIRATVSDWGRTEGSTPMLEVLQFGGYVPGCAFQAGRRLQTYDPKRTGNDLLFEIPASRVGLFLLRLMVHDRGWPRIIDEAAVEVVATPALGALELHGGPQFELNQKIRLSVNDASLFSDAELWVAPFRHGVVAVGGAESHTHGHGQSRVRNPGEMVEVLAAQPGSWEARLLRCAHECTIIDIIDFQVRDPNSPIALGVGLPSIYLRNDLAVRGDPWPPIGRFLTGETCKPWETPDESLVLRLVTLKEGSLVPVEGPLEWGQGFFVEGRLAEAAKQSSYEVTIDGPDGEAQRVMLYRADDPKVVRSGMRYLIWRAEGGEGDARD